MIQDADFVIIAVPTPVTKAKDPDLKPVESAWKIVGYSPERTNPGDEEHTLPTISMKNFR